MFVVYLLMTVRKSDLFFIYLLELMHKTFISASEVCESDRGVISLFSCKIFNFI